MLPLSCENSYHQKKKKKEEEEANVGKEVEKRECSCTVDENVKLV